MEKTMYLMTQKLMEPGTDDGAQGLWDLRTVSWTTSERYAKHHTKKPQ